VKALIKKRTDFEYRLRRRAADRRDFAKYVEYETALDGLIKKRKTRLGVKKGKASNFSCSRQVLPSTHEDGFLLHTC
jgi:U3 small nucleolar RNA-associated protein 6